MAEEKAHINYSLEDIERYLKGGMSAKEMHEMERAALQDPFLADAIEGYSSASFEQSHKHLNEITAALQNENEAVKIVPLPTKSFYWWRVAAIIILVVGIGAVSWYIFDLDNKTELNNVAVVQEKKSGNTDTVTKELMNDTSNTSLIAQNKSTPSLQAKRKKNLHKEKQEKVAAFSLTDTQQAASKALKNNADSIIVTDKNDASQSAALSAPPRYDTQKLEGKASRVIVQDKRYLFSNNNALNNFRGRVIDNNNQPVPNAIVSLSNRYAAYTDANGYFKIEAPDSLLTANISSIGYIPRDTLLKSNYANNIVIIPDKNPLSEVAVTGFSTKKKALKRNESADSAYPSGGWESFQEYVYKKLGKPLDTLNNDEVDDDVQIEFLIDENGVPYNFTVLKSLNDETASRAIEIIKEGPRWITMHKNKKGKVTIQF